MTTTASPQPAASITGLGQVSIPVIDIERATAFYRDVLGLTFLFSAGTMAFFSAGNIRLMLSKAERTETDMLANSTRSIFYYKVADLDATFAVLSVHGAKVESKPHLVAPMPDHELWMAFFRDSEENLFALMSERPVHHGGAENTEQGERA